MDTNTALKSFAALSQATRLEAFRILVKQGREGLAAGLLSDAIGIPQNTLSFHLAHLVQAGLITSEKQGRRVIYYADLAATQSLLRFLLEDCCAVDSTTCKDVTKLLKKACC